MMTTDISSPIHMILGFNIFVQYLVVCIFYRLEIFSLSLPFSPFVSNLQMSGVDRKERNGEIIPQQ